MRNSKVIVDFEIRTWIPKKVASLPILGLDSRSRFSDLAFHSQLWFECIWYYLLEPCTNFLIFLWHLTFLLNHEGNTEKEKNCYVVLQCNIPRIRWEIGLWGGGGALLHTAKTKCRKFEINIPKKGISGPQSQFPHSCVCDRIIYSHDGSACSAGENM